MRVLFFSDIHSDFAALDKIVTAQADRYFAVGDLVNWAKGLDKVGEVLKPLGDRLSVIPGNHESEADIAALCSKFGFEPMHRKSTTIDGYHLAALGYSNPTPFNTPGEYSEDEIARYLEPFANLKPLILVCHCPPLDSPLDQGSQGQHFGSGAVRDFIAAHQPEWFFCGHIHEAAGIECTLGKTRARNVGKKGFLLDF